MKNTEIQTAVIYGRVSTQDQDNERQSTSLNEWANRNDVEVIKTFEDKISGSSKLKSRKMYQELITFIESENVKLILCYSISRLARSTGEALEAIEFFTDKGINLFFLDTQSFTLRDGKLTKETEFTLTILSSVATLERRNIVDNTSSGLYNVASKGKSFGSPPLGYDVDENGHLQINEREAQIVRMIFSTYLKVGTLSGTVKVINANPEVRTKRGGKFMNQAVKMALKAEVYTGKREYKGLKIPVPQIIDIETYERVQLKIGDSKGFRTKRKHTNPLERGVAKCAVCGENIYLHTSGHTSKYKCRTTSYAELKRMTKDSCFLASFYLMNNVLIDVIRLAHERNGEDVGVGFKEEIEGKIMELQGQRGQAEIKLRQAEQKPKKMRELFLNGLATIDEVKGAQAAVKDELSALNSDIDSFNDRINQLYERLENFGDNSLSIEQLANIDNLHSYCKGLRIEVEKMKDESNLAKAFYRDILNKKPDSRVSLFRLKVQAATWTEEVVCVPRRTIYSRMMPSKPVKIEVGGQKVTLTDESPFYPYAVIYDEKYTRKQDK